MVRVRQRNSLGQRIRLLTGKRLKSENCLCAECSFYESVVKPSGVLRDCNVDMAGIINTVPPCTDANCDDLNTSLLFDNTTWTNSTAGANRVCSFKQVIPNGIVVSPICSVLGSAEFDFSATLRTSLSTGCFVDFELLVTANGLGGTPRWGSVESGSNGRLLFSQFVGGSAIVLPNTFSEFSLCDETSSTATIQLV